MAPDDVDGLLRMRLRDVLFAHWPVDPGAVGDRLPSGVDVVTHDGDAWVSVVALEAANVRPRGAPVGLTFPQLNVRTYVEREGDDERSVFFFALDADDEVGVPVARGLYSLPYYRADAQLRRREGGAVDFASHRTHRGAPAAHFDATYRPVGDAFEAESDSRDGFLTENYRFYASGRTLVYGDIDHDPWSLYDAEADIRTNTLFAACDLPTPTTDPVCHYSPGTDVTAGRVHLARD